MRHTTLIWRCARQNNGTLVEEPIIWPKRNSTNTTRETTRVESLAREVCRIFIDYWSTKMKSISKHSNKYKLYKQDYWMCHYCKDVITLEDMCIDHKHPKSLWGKNCFENYVACCRTCNSKKWSMPYEEFIIVIWYYRQWLCKYEETAEYHLYSKLKQKYDVKNHR